MTFFVIRMFICTSIDINVINNIISVQMNLYYNNKIIIIIAMSLQKLIIARAQPSVYKKWLKDAKKGLEIVTGWLRRLHKSTVNNRYAPLNEPTAD